MDQPKKCFLNQSERDSLIATLRLERDKRICYRIHTILLLDEGMTYNQVARLLFLGEGTVRRYYTTFVQQEREDFLTIDYSGKSSKLTKDQQDQLSHFVETNHPTSCLMIIAYIEKEFGKKYTPSGVTALLHRLEFTYKKPKLIPGKIDPEAQEKFLKDLEALENKLGKHDVLLYMDGVHPQHNSKPAYGWFKKGKNHHLKANTGRKRININGIINPNSLETIYRFDETINAQSTIELFKQIEEKYDQADRICIACDNAGYYRSQIVKKYLKYSKIELKFLPPYSPNLNLIERFWRFMNKKVRNNKYYSTFKEFQEAIYTFFTKIPTYRLELKSLLRKKFYVCDF